MTLEEKAQAARAIRSGARALSELVERVETEAPDLLAKAGQELRATGRVLFRLFGPALASLDPTTTAAPPPPPTERDEKK